MNFAIWEQALEKARKLPEKKNGNPKKNSLQKKKGHQMEFLRESTEDANKKSPEFRMHLISVSFFFRKDFWPFHPPGKPEISSLTKNVKRVAMNISPRHRLLKSLSHHVAAVKKQTESESKNHVELPNLSTKQSHKPSAQQFCVLFQAKKLPTGPQLLTSTPWLIFVFTRNFEAPSPRPPYLPHHFHFQPHPYAG